MSARTTPGSALAATLRVGRVGQVGRVARRVRAMGARETAQRLAARLYQRTGAAALDFPLLPGDVTGPDEAARSLPRCRPRPGSRSRSAGSRCPPGCGRAGTRRCSGWSRRSRTRATGACCTCTTGTAATSSSGPTWSGAAGRGSARRCATSPTGSQASTPAWRRPGRAPTCSRAAAWHRCGACTSCRTTSRTSTRTARSTRSPRTPTAWACGCWRSARWWRATCGRSTPTWTWSPSAATPMSTAPSGGRPARASCCTPSPTSHGAATTSRGWPWSGSTPATPSRRSTSTATRCGTCACPSPSTAASPPTR